MIKKLLVVLVAFVLIVSCAFSASAGFNLSGEFASSSEDCYIDGAGYSEQYGISCSFFLNDYVQSASVYEGYVTVNDTSATPFYTRTYSSNELNASTGYGFGFMVDDSMNFNVDNGFTIIVRGYNGTWCSASSLEAPVIEEPVEDEPDVLSLLKTISHNQEMIIYILLFISSY